MRRSKTACEKETELVVGLGIGLGEVFKGLGSFIELVSEMAEKGQEEVERTGEIKTPE